MSDRQFRLAIDEGISHETGSVLGRVDAHLAHAVWTAAGFLCLPDGTVELVSLHRQEAANDPINFGLRHEDPAVGKVARVAYNRVYPATSRATACSST